MLPNGNCQNTLEEQAKNSMGIKNKARVKRTQDANKILKAYNIEPEMQQVSIQPLPL